MYQDIIAQINEIAEGMSIGKVYDYSMIPMEKFLANVEKAAQIIGDDVRSVLNSYITILDLVTRNSDIVGLRTLLQLIGRYLEYADTVIILADAAKALDAYENKNVHYCRKIAQCNYYINMLRNTEYYQKHEIPGSMPFSGKGVVYTVIVGEYDNVLDPLHINEDWDYVLFTDNRNIKSDVWKIIYIDNTKRLDMVRFSRECKVLPFEYLSEYDYSIYLDGSLQIIGNIEEYIKKYSKNSSMLCLAHPENTDIYEEAKLCLELGKGNQEQIVKQIEKYKEKGFPEQYGLTANGVLIRNHRDEKLKKVMNDWWDEILNESSRDQISFTYCCWKNEFVFDVAPINIWDNEFFKYNIHNR